MKYLFSLCLLLVLSGCASFGEGVATAVLQKDDETDTRMCEISGQRFDGIASKFSENQNHLKVLKIHGVGSHSPGYSTQFMEKLADELELNSRSSHYKEIHLTDPKLPGEKLGVLRIKRLINEDHSKVLIYYELTWSEITDAEKSKLKYDSSGEYSYRRAEVNNLLKQFSNDTGPDPMIYLGESRELILASFRNAFCWMISYNWNEIPEKTSKSCQPLTHAAVKNLADDKYSIVSHSLGSRIVMDGMHSIINNFNEKAKTHKTSMESEFIEGMKKQNISLYMLSNQLPLLQMGSKPTDVTGNQSKYCESDGASYNDRLVQSTKIIAFSDPNDILSYAIPQDFAENAIDSRLCANITNITINVAKEVDLFGFGKFANPLTAHTAYDSDDRVVALIAHGIGNPETTDLVKERCKWIRFVN